MDESKKASTSMKQVELNGYKFMVDTDLLDDVEAFEYIDRIENKKQVAAIVPLLEFLVGAEAYADMKKHFSDLDGEAHKSEPGYRPRFRITALSDIYSAIIEQFDPKG